MAVAYPESSRSGIAPRSWGRRPGGAGPPGRPRPPATLLVPAAVVAGLMLLPLVYLLARATGSSAEVWATLARPRTLELLGRTVALAAAVTLLSGLIALPLAWLLARTDLPGRRLWSVATALPLVIPTYVGGLAFVSLFGPRGLLQQALAPLGVERIPEIYGFPGALLALTFATYPYVLLNVRPALERLDPAMEEASSSLGKGAWATFGRVILPQLRPAIAAGSLLVALYVLSDFGAVSLLQFDSFTRAIYTQYQGSLDRRAAAALALVLVALTAAVLALESALRGRARYHRVGRGAAQRRRLIRLRAWRWPALAFCGVVVGLALLLPLGVLLYWLGVGLRQGNVIQVVWLPAWNAVQASALAALAAALAAVPLAVISVRYPGRITSLLERSTYAGYALPGIVIALALVFFGANYATPLYQTLWLLVFAYVVRFLPQAVGAARAAVLQINPHLEEAARGLGRRPIAVLATVTVPLIRPGLLAGAALVFLTAMKELPATLLLAPIGYATLATSIWTWAAEARYAQAAAPSLLLVLVSSTALLLLLSDGGGSPDG
jgi:iron(III) transport system permease protein